MGKLKNPSLDLEIAIDLLETELFYEEGKDYFLQHLDELTGEKCKELVLKGNSWLVNSKSIEDSLYAALSCGNADDIPSRFTVSAFLSAWESVNWELIAEECRNSLVDDDYEL